MQRGKSTRHRYGAQNSTKHRVRREELTHKTLIHTAWENPQITLRRVEIASTRLGVDVDAHIGRSTKVVHSSSGGGGIYSLCSDEYGSRGAGVCSQKAAAVPHPSPLCPLSSAP